MPTPHPIRMTQEEAILRFADQTRDYLHEIRKRIAEAAPPGADEEEMAFLVTHRQRGMGPMFVIEHV